MIGMKVRTLLNVREVRKAVNESVVKPLDNVAMAIQSEAQTSMQGSGQERKASTAPHPPNVQSSILWNSIKWALLGINNRVIGPTKLAWYGMLHEFGGIFKTKRGTGKMHIPARPFMVPALEEIVRHIGRYFKGIKIGLTPTGRRLNRKKTP